MLLDSRTRPIHQILEAYLPPEALAYALRLWSEEYVHQQNISILSFVDAFYHRQPLPYSRQHIYSSLMPALMEVIAIRSTFDENTTDLYEFPDFDKVADAAPRAAGVAGSMTGSRPAATLAQPTPMQPAAASRAPIPPSPPIGQRSAPAPAPVPVKDERFSAFAAFVRRLMRSLSEERRKKMLFYNRKSFIQAVPESISHSFYGWLQTNNDYFEHPDLDTDSMRQVVHHIYAGMCNYLGPLEADEALMKAANYIDENFSREAIDVRDLL